MHQGTCCEMMWIEEKNVLIKQPIDTEVTLYQCVLVDNKLSVLKEET